MLKDVDTAERNPSTAAWDVFVFGQFLLAPTTRTLSRDGDLVRVGDRAHDILITLVERAGRVVSKAELLSLVWPAMFIDESALRVHIAALRKALGDGESGMRFIVNVRGRGYTFVAKVKRVSDGGNDIRSLATTVSHDRG